MPLDPTLYDTYSSIGLWRIALSKARGSGNGQTDCRVHMNMCYSNIIVLGTKEVQPSCHCLSFVNIR